MSQKRAAESEDGTEGTESAGAPPATRRRIDAPDKDRSAEPPLIEEVFAVGNILPDFTLVVENGADKMAFKVHKLYLAGVSKVFEWMIRCGDKAEDQEGNGTVSKSALLRQVAVD